MKIFIKSLLFLVIFFLPFIFIYAQFIPEPLSLSASPSSPSSGQTVTFQAATPSFDKNATFFTWTVQGVLRRDLSGLAKDAITVVAGDVGSAIRVSVASNNTSGSSSVSVTAYVTDLALPWHAETYTPAWYKGKALPVQNSVVAVSAIPTIIIGGVRIAHENLIYHWSLDDEENISEGLGQQTFRMQTSDLPKTSHWVRVVIEDIKKIVRKEGEVFIIPGAPRAALYAITPLGGIEPRAAISIFTAAARGVLDFQIEPFFFSSKTRKKLSYQWTLAGAAIQGSPQNPFILSIDTSAQSRGGFQIGASVDDDNNLVPAASKLFTLFLP